MRALLTTVLLWSALGGAATSQPSAPDRAAQRWLERARAHLRAGRHPRARRYLRRAQERAPTWPAPLLAAEPLLRSEAVTDAAEDARWILARASEVVPGDETEARALRRLVAWAHAWLGDTASALRTVVSGDQDRQGAEDLRALAAWWVARGELAAAQRALERAVRSWPQEPTLRRDLAAVALARGRPDMAVRVLLEVVRAHPDDAAARRELAGAYLAAGRGVEALQIYRALGDERGGDAAWLDYAEAALELGRPDEAAEAARRAAPSTRRWTALGLALAALGQHAQARQALAQATDDPRARQALRALGAGRDGGSATSPTVRP